MGFVRVRFELVQVHALTNQFGPEGRPVSNDRLGHFARPIRSSTPLAGVPEAVGPLGCHVRGAAIAEIGYARSMKHLAPTPGRQARGSVQMARTFASARYSES